MKKYTMRRRRNVIYLRVLIVSSRQETLLLHIKFYLYCLVANKTMSVVLKQ